MHEKDQILEGHSSEEKGAYLGAIASLATADRQASQEELEFLGYLADSAGISPNQKDRLLQSATHIADDQLNDYLNTLKTGELKFSLIADLILFAKSDSHYSGAEKETIQNIAGHLGITKLSFSQIEQLTDTALNRGFHSESLKKKVGVAEVLHQDDPDKKLYLDLKKISKGLLGTGSSPLLSRLRKITHSDIKEVAAPWYREEPESGRNTSDGLRSLIGSLSGTRGFGPSAGLLSKIRLSAKNK